MDTLVTLCTSVTAQVLRRIADALDTPAPPDTPPVVVHIANVTIHETTTRPTLFGRKKE